MGQEKEIPNFSFDFSANKSLCIITGSGEINFRQSTDAMRFVAQHESFSPECNVVVDLYAMDYHPSYDELMGIVDTLKLLKDSYKGKVAIVTKQNLNIIAKLVSIYCELAGMKMKAFTNTEEAKKWVTSTE